MYKLYGNPGWGSVLIEAQLAWYGLPFEAVDIGDLFAAPEARDRLAPLNPLVQVPTLILPDGFVMTESAAITLHLADITGSTDMVPQAGDPARPAFLRWLVFLVANIYPTFTFADEPARFVPLEAAREGYRATVDAHARKLWNMVEQHAEAPWFLGERFSALDIFVAVMTRWRPQRLWFTAHCPKLSAIAVSADRLPKLASSGSGISRRDAMIRIAPFLALDERDIEESFMRASGPGGQNVNKVSTAVELRLDTIRLALPPDMRARLEYLAGRQLTEAGLLIVTSQKTRSQERNRADALEKLVGLLRRAAQRPARRIATRPTKASKTRRLEAKAQRAKTKSLRRVKPTHD